MQQTGAIINQHILALIESQNNNTTTTPPPPPPPVQIGDVGDAAASLLALAVLDVVALFVRALPVDDAPCVVSGSRDAEPDDASGDARLLRAHEANPSEIEYCIDVP
jgi:hypothetical protein